MYLALPSLITPLDTFIHFCHSLRIKVLRLIAMKSAILSLLLAGAAIAVPIVNEQTTYNVTEFEELRDAAIERHEKLMKKRQALGMLNSLMGMTTKSSKHPPDF